VRNAPGRRAAAQPAAARHAVAWARQGLQRVVQRAAGALLAALIALIALVVAMPASATTLRIASAFDPQSMDPHGLALLYHGRIAYQLYESLVGRDAEFRLEPALALRWEAIEPTRWRFHLRPGVRFHDGQTMTVDDVVFSIGRAMGPTSQRAFVLKGVLRAEPAGPMAVDLVLDAPDAVLPEKLQYVPIMNRAWCEQHGVQRAQDFNAREETYAVRHANGTGPYRLQAYEPDRQTVLQRHADWWGRDDPRNGRIDEIRFLSIQSDATRLAALASGEVDLVLDPPFQDVARLQRDPRLRILSIGDLGQQYLSLDTARERLADGDAGGGNPFRDLRVRQAVWHALNIELIIDKVLRGQAEPATGFLSPRTDGVAAAPPVRLPFDPAAARRLLAEAGYPDGFDVTLDCVNVAWRQAVCQAAAAMLTQVGIRTTLRVAPASQFFPKLTQAQISLAEFGWTGSADPWASLNALFRSWDRSGLGTFNAGRYRDPTLDALIDGLRTEPDLTRRRAMVVQALGRIAERLPVVPLYRRKLNWVMDRRFDAVIWPNDMIELRWVKGP